MALVLIVGFGSTFAFASDEFINDRADRRHLNNIECLQYRNCRNPESIEDRRCDGTKCIDNTFCEEVREDCREECREDFREYKRLNHHHNNKSH